MFHCLQTIIAIAAAIPWSTASLMPTSTSNSTSANQTVSSGAFTAPGFRPGNQIPFIYTTWYPPLNTPDWLRVGSTTTVTSGTSTITEIPTATAEAPWDITTATADGDGYAAGDYVFPLSDSGKEKLGEIFSGIEAACGLPVRRRDEHTLKRQSTPADCARDFLVESEVAAWDAGITVTTVTLTAGDVAVGVQGVGAAVVVVLSAWILGGGKISENEAVTLPVSAITKVDESLVDLGEESEDEDEIDEVPSAGHTYFVASEEDEVKAAQAIGDWQRMEPWAVRRLSRVLPLQPALCQNSPSSAPFNGDEMDVSRATTDFCSQNAAEWYAVEGSKYTKFDLSDHSFWITAEVYEEHGSPYCDTLFLDVAECTELLRYVMTSCANDENTETTGGEAYGECLTYRITIDPSTENSEPPTWEDANAG